MTHTRNLAAAAAVLLLVGCSDDAPQSTSANPPGNGVCLEKAQIDHADILSDGVILFYMKAGKIWQNTLRFDCTGLKLENGFSYENDASEVCSNQQTIRVLRTGAYCELGQFTPFTPPALPKP